MNQNSISEFIEKARKAKGLTQRQLAKELGVSNTAISKWEHGYNLPDISMLEPLSEALDVEVIELIRAQNLTHEECTKKKATKAQKNRIKRRIITLIIAIISIMSTYHLTSRSFKKSIKDLEDNTIEVYEITSKNKDFSIDGYLIINSKESIIILNKILYQGVEQGTTKFTNIINIDTHFIIDNKKISSFNKTRTKNGEFNEHLNNVRINQKITTNLITLKPKFYTAKLEFEIKYKNEKREIITTDLKLKKRFIN